MAHVIQRIATSMKRQNVDADDLFYSIDVNKDHNVSYSELEAVLLKYEPTLTHQECFSAFESIDKDSSGYVSLPEFRAALRSASGPTAVRRGAEAIPTFGGHTFAAEQLFELTLGLFRKFDTDCSGYLDFQELTAMLHGLDAARWTPERIVALLREMDADKDQRIRFEEFYRWASLGGEDSCALLSGHGAAGEEDVLRTAAATAADRASRGQWPEVLNLLSQHQDAFINTIVEGCDYGLIHFACDQGRGDVAGELLDNHCADPRVLTLSGKTAPSIARAKGWTAVEERVNVALSKMAITWAAEQAWMNVMDVLHMHPGIVNILPDGFTHRLLHYAASQGRKEIVTTLTNSFGADTSLPDNEGRPPIDLAVQMRHVHLVECLRVTHDPANGRAAVKKLTGSKDPPSFGPVASEKDGNPGITAADGTAVLDTVLQNLLGMHPSTRWGPGDTDGEDSEGEEAPRARKGFLSGVFSSSRTSQPTTQRVLSERALTQIGSLGVAGSLNNIGMEKGPLGFIADVNYGDRRNMTVSTPARKRYESTLETLGSAIYCFNNHHQPCVAMVLLGDQIDKRDVVGADLAAYSVLEQLARFHRPDRVGWLLGHHDTRHSAFFQQHRQLARGAHSNSPVSGAFCYEFPKFGEDNSNWLFIALDPYAVMANGSADSALWLRDGRNIDRHVRLHGAIGPAQLQWLESRLAACENSGHCVCILSNSSLHGKKFLTSPPDRSHVGISSCVQNSREVLEVIRKYTCVKLVLSGHDHRGSHYQDRTGVHHLSLPACLNAQRGSLSGVLLWLNKPFAAVDYLVEPGKTLARLFLKFE